VEVHEWRSRNVEKEDDNAEIPKSQGNIPQLRNSIEELKDFTSDSSRIKHGEERVAEPKERVRNILREKVDSIVKVARNLDKRPRSNHKIQGPMSLSGTAKTGNAPDGEDT